MSRKLPHDAEAERSVIGSVLVRPEALDDLRALLVPSDFYDPRHEEIFTAMLGVKDRGLRVDLVTVSSELRRTKRMGMLDASGAEAFISDLTLIGTLSSPESAAKIVKDKSSKRQIIMAAEAQAAMAFADEKDASEILEHGHAALVAVSDRSLASEPQPIRAALLEAATSIKARYEHKSAVVGITWGVFDLDEMTGGRQAGRLEVLGGRPGHGKSALALQAMLAGADKGHPGLMFSLEMMKQELGERAIAQEARLDGTALRSGMIQSIEFARATEAVRQLKDLPIWVDDQGGQDIYAICAKARRWHRKHAQTGKQAQIVVDFLQLVKASSSKNRRSREEEVGEISRTLKALAKELKASVLALASLNRECEKRTDKRPTPSDLRDSGSIESDADLILMVYRDELYNTESKDKGIAELIVGKHRGGPVGTVHAKYFAPQTRFAPLSWRNDT